MGRRGPAEGELVQRVAQRVDGWLDEASQEAFGRPVDLLFLQDGSLLIYDDVGNAIYRVTY